MATPYVLLLNQKRLGLNSEDVNVLLNLFAHWHSPDRMPFPRTRTIAKRMGVSERTVHRVMKRLIDRGFIAKEHRKRYTAQRYDITGIKSALQQLAEERLEIGVPIEMADEMETPPKVLTLAEAL
jgi:predicted transcriptional regulator